MPTIKIPVPFRKQYFDKMAEKAGLIIAGTDEVGRSCLCGPVVVAAAALKPRPLRQGKKPYFTDSKAMTLEERETAYAWLIKNCWYATASVHPRGIDAINIYQATLVAMKRAVIQLHLSCPEPLAAVLVDAMPLKIPELWPAKELFGAQASPILEAPWGNILYFNKGEEHSAAIAAASVIAKVTRDRLMTSFNTLFPGYHLDKHKGYGTPSHQEQLALLGPTIIQRYSFTYKQMQQAAVEQNLSIMDLENAETTSV